MDCDGNAVTVDEIGILKLLNDIKRKAKVALEQLRKMSWSFPPDFKFNREEINER